MCSILFCVPPQTPVSVCYAQVQGMSSMAAMFILNMDEVQVFISFSNLINRPCQMAFYQVDQPLVHTHVCLSVLLRTLVGMLPSIAPNP